MKNRSHVTLNREYCITADFEWNDADQFTGRSHFGQKPRGGIFCGSKENINVIAAPDRERHLISPEITGGTTGADRSLDKEEAPFINSSGFNHREPNLRTRKERLDLTSMGFTQGVLAIANQTNSLGTARHECNGDDQRCLSKCRRLQK
jgi:hypothetical protein